MPDEQENLAEFWKEQVWNSYDPAKMLLNMSQSVLGITGDYVKHLITFRQLVKLYGRKSVYYSILDCAEIENFSGDPLRILSYFCKKRLDVKTQTSDIISIEEIEKKIEKVSKIKNKISKKEEKIDEL